MYQRILVPTDGSRLAQEAARAAVALAHSTGATIIGFHALPSYEKSTYNTVVISPGWITEQKFDKLTQRAAKKYLAAIEDMADGDGVPFEGYTVTAEQPALAIVQAAQDEGCDLIFMGSHGHGNLAQIFLGGVTTKVLSICDLPVLVHRPANRAGSRKKTRKDR